MNKPGALADVPFVKGGVLLLLLSCAAFGLVGWTAAAQGATTLISAGAVWQYRDGGVDLGTEWRGTNVDVGKWPSGLAQLGFGDGDERTVLMNWQNPTDGTAYTTYYFRHAFQVADPAAFSNLSVRLLRDDGAIVYLNGEELFRDLMPEGEVDYRTLSQGCAPDDGRDFVQRWVNPGRLRAGVNYIAVEIHNCNPVNHDISFDMSLTGNVPVPPPSVAIQRFGTNVVVSWPTGYVGYRLESATALGAGAWSGMTNPSVQVQGRLMSTNRITDPQRFFQLRLE